jgi:hypothetical protein
VWGAYGVVALALCSELFGLRLLKRQTEATLSDAQLVAELAEAERRARPLDRP